MKHATKSRDLLYNNGIYRNPLQRYRAILTMVTRATLARSPPVNLADLKGLPGMRQHILCRPGSLSFHQQFGWWGQVEVFLSCRKEIGYTLHVPYFLYISISYVAVMSCCNNVPLLTGKHNLSFNTSAVFLNSLPSEWIHTSDKQWFNSLAPGIFKMNFRYHGKFFKVYFSDWWLRYLSWSWPQMNVTWPFWWSINISSGAIWQQAWCHLATSCYLSQCWPRAMSPYGVTWPQCVDKRHIHILYKQHYH